MTLGRQEKIGSDRDQFILKNIRHLAQFFMLSVRQRSDYIDKTKFQSKYFKVMKADILNKGTQLKMLWYLQGNQKVIFKPKRYEREHVIKGKGNWLPIHINLPIVIMK